MSNIKQQAGNAVRDGKAAVESARDAAGEAFQNVSEHAGEVASQVRDAGRQAAGYARDQFDHYSGEARHAYGRARDTARDWEHSAEGYIQRSPLRTVLIAAGVGLLIGFLLPRHRGE